MPDKITMTFQCSQNWEHMQITSEGRYCDLCCKTVHDFSNKSPYEIAKASHDEVCGSFLAEQIDPDLTPIEVPFSIRAAILTIGTVLGLELNQAVGQKLDAPHKIETVTTDSTQAIPAASVEARPEHSKAHGPGECENVKRPVRRKYYLSKRFPFIVKRRVWLAGRFRL